MRRFLALKAIRDDQELVRQLSPENRQTLEGRFRDAEEDIPFRLLKTYRHLAKLEEEVEWFDLGLPTVGEKGPLARRVKDFLKSQELLLDRISPRQILQKAISEDEDEKPLDEIYGAFLKFPHLPMLEDESVLLRAIRQGVQEGTFGVRSGERTYFQQEMPDMALEYGVVLVRREVVPPPTVRPTISPQEVLAIGWNKREVSVREVYESLSRCRRGDFTHEREFAEAFLEALDKGREESLFEVTTPEVDEGPVELEHLLERGKITLAAPPPPPEGVSHYTLRARVPWEKMSDFVRGVIIPLQGEGARLDIEISLTAHSEEGIKKTTLDQKVRETLRQIGAQVLEEGEE